MKDRSSGEDPMQVVFFGGARPSHEPPSCCWQDTLALSSQIACSGSGEGIIEGSNVTVGPELAFILGLSDGAVEGIELGAVDGTAVGSWDGIPVGRELGPTDGVPDGCVLGSPVGEEDGPAEGKELGSWLLDGLSLGAELLDGAALG
mmetsp:Transcript_17307/g.42261  ORF Transcript_17307/g.42261 Transcript_17307/m.42261 type:complete len:147 (+) Transcript_17307:1946-2386(+)